MTGKPFSLGATGWPDGEPAGSTTPTQPVPPFTGPPSNIVDLPSNQIPKGSSLTIGLTTDPSSQAVRPVLVCRDWRAFERPIWRGNAWLRSEGQSEPHDQVNRS
jgi:hypothetical protein